MTCDRPSGALLVRRSSSLAFALGLAAAAVFLWAVGADLYWLRVLSKPVPVLVMALALTRRAGEDRYRRRIAAGLLLCLAGDVLLEVGDTTFLAGVGAFLLGHLAYIAAFSSRGRALRPWVAVPFVVWGLGAFLFLLPDLREHEMSLPVGVYVAVICTMMWRAVASLPARERASLGILAGALGAIVFGVSDTLIALDRFHAPIPGVRYPIILLYWLGQLGITASALLERGRESAIGAAVADEGGGPTPPVTPAG